ncbi:hypothetical protein [Streptomyces sp. HPF1205]|uniref:hypothetical protein n=1 Tax=Streptomyces sp. HPF1205 TaxID=2873262 RepID=UPI001CEC09BD|nr:hypothetical protein [Streptomyces sp. HPF1205]
MRRIYALVGATAVLTPLLLANAGSAAASGGGSLTLAMVGRDGKAVAGQARAVNLKTLGVYTLTTGKAVKVPAGGYDVVADIWNTKDGTDTLGARHVTVSSGSVKVGFDARGGRPVREALTPALPSSGYDQQLRADICVGDTPGEIDAYADPGHMYVIPSGIAGIKLAYGASWTPRTAGGDHYSVVAEYGKGVPRGVSATFHRSTLASIAVTARSGPQTGQALVQLDSDSGDSCEWGIENLGVEDTLPFGFTAHVSAGSWEISQDAQDFIAGTWHQYGKGRHYKTVIGHAVWGPGGQLPYTWDGGNIYLNTTTMFADPELPDYSDARVAYKLTKSGRTVVSRTIDMFSTLETKLPGAGWYTLSESATHTHAMPASALSPKSSLLLHFYADPSKVQQIRGYLTRFWPEALNVRNQAKPGATTTVDLGLQRSRPQDGQVRQLSDSVKKVQAWASTDGGRTWHTVQVSHSGSAWKAVVHDPRSGAVSLRSEVTDAYGDTATTTVVNAYAVG